MTQETQETSKAPLPITVDATILTAVTECPRLMKWKYMEHLRPKDESIHLHAGKAYAKGLETARTLYFQLGHTHADAVHQAKVALAEAYGDRECHDERKTKDRMLGALTEYFKRWPMDAERFVPVSLPDGTFAVEMSFAIPWEAGPLHPSGVPFIICGRFDAVVKDRDTNALYNLDDKTATQLGASWVRKWDLRGQFINYTWAMRNAGVNIAGTVVRGMALYVNNRYGQAEAVIPCASHLVEEWKRRVSFTLQQMVDMYNGDYFPPAYNDACTSYGGCDYRIPCLSADPQPWLASKFVKRVWSPLHTEEEEAA